MNQRLSRTALPLLLAALSTFVAGCASSPPAGPPAEPVAAALEGYWGIELKLIDHTVEGRLHFTREGSALIGSYSDNEGNESEIAKLRAGNGKISWEMDQKRGTLVATGTIQGTIMSGKMKLRRTSEDVDPGFATTTPGRHGSGRRAGEPDSYEWTAVKRAETPAK